MKIPSSEDNNNFTLLRNLLALAVVFGHFKLLSGTPAPAFPFNLADAAVDSFFVVSGYLITGSYERTRGLAPFYLRRLFRLYPLYACAVLVQTVVMMLLLPGGPFSAPHSTLRYLGFNLFFMNFAQYRHRRRPVRASQPGDQSQPLDAQDRDRFLSDCPGHLCRRSAVAWLGAGRDFCRVGSV